MKKYYCLVAGLPEIRIDDNKQNFDLKEFKEELRANLSEGDFELIKLFYRKFDNLNLIAYLKDAEAKLDDRGNLTQDDFTEILRMVKEEENPKDERIPVYFKEFIPAWLEEKPLFPDMAWEDQLATLYYDDALKCRNEFFSSWFAFNLNVQNILTAINCRNYDLDLGPAIVGNSEIANTIRESNSKDFGLAAIFPYLDDVLHISEEANLYERERRIDALRWKWLEENAFFKYFTVEKVFAYLLQLEMIERWVKLSQETGLKIFRDFVQELQHSFEFPEEFKLNK
ncbi:MULTISPECIES: DUF2764 family protein [Prolixibacter]|uniref:Uncharacterized protein DUF2764 n=1 Tax=Prolixibacter denitrificans TaxID=1541063 RepID=A0A2P8C8I9_9BACT|nr:MULTISPECIES: DUF2764 family protein [Prolixibacter]PSK81275.1 uncharacterized protein DUF2764 [Prolixibacter denitrificans]GET21641.1 hypothetical protein JCM18694_18870 [Prolixibacter denitrificans]GET24257.1 hypothetical protein NT017_05860 [Prolixibacter sp. NT017]